MFYLHGLAAGIYPASWSHWCSRTGREEFVQDADNQYAAAYTESRAASRQCAADMVRAAKAVGK